MAELMVELKAGLMDVMMELEMVVCSVAEVVALKAVWKVYMTDFSWVGARDYVKVGARVAWTDASKVA